VKNKLPRFLWFTVYIDFSGLLTRRGMLPVKCTLHPSLVFSYIGSVPTRHSSSRRQPSFTALNRWRHRHLGAGAAIMLGIGPDSTFFFFFLN